VNGVLVRVALDEEAFRDLVAGKIVHAPTDKGAVEFILSDIGWSRMFVAIDDAMRAQRDVSLDPHDAGGRAEPK
jgi:hypothetical protein